MTEIDPRSRIKIVMGYKAHIDTLTTSIIITLENKKEVFATFAHNQASPYDISNLELIEKLRALADHIEINHSC